MTAMKQRPGAAKMRETMRKIAEKIVDGLACAAQATALHEGLSWEPENPPVRRKRTGEHQ